MRRAALLASALLLSPLAAISAALPSGSDTAGVAALSASASVSPDATAGVLEGATVEVRGRALPPQASERSLSGAQARRMPGAAGDVVRAVGTLPGAVTPNDYLANLLVRGSGMDDNLIQLDGFPAAYPFHFGGLESVFHPGLIGEVLFLPGGYDARFGDTLGGVLDLHSREPRPGLHGEVGLSLIQAQGLASVASAKGSSVEGAFRQGELQLVLPPDARELGLPKWQDWQGQARLPVGAGVLRVLAFGARDSLLAHGGPGHSDSRWDSGFDALGLGWLGRVGGWRVDARAWGQDALQAVDLGPDLQLTQRPYGVGGAVDATTFAGAGHGLDLGAQWQQTRTVLQGHFARLPVELGTGIDFNALSATAVDALGSKAVLSAWAQDRWQLMPGAAMTLGGRFDRVDLTGEFHFSPRWTLSVQAWDGGTLTADFGDYFQSPAPMETVPGWNSAAVGSDLVRSYAAGVEQQWHGWDLDLEAWRKGFQRDIPTVLVPTGVSGTPDLALNAVDTGWAEGAEALLRLPARGGVSGWLSYAWSDVMRSSGVGGTYPGDFSQPQVAGLLLQWQGPWGLLLGGRLRLASGIPYTPIASRSQDPVSGKWSPVFGATNSARLPDYRRLDLRLERRWARSEPAAGWRSVTAYVEVFNALDADNITSVTYEDDYSDIRRIRQFPRLAFAGVDLAF